MNGKNLVLFFVVLACMIANADVWSQLEGVSKWSFWLGFVATVIILGENVLLNYALDKLNKDFNRFKRRGR